jgi:hypothetical protein
MTEMEKLTEAARVAAQNHERALEEEKLASDEFTRCRLTATPAEFGELKSKAEQKSLIVAATFKRKLNTQAELEFALGQEAQRAQQESDRQKLEAMREELNDGTIALAQKRELCFKLQREIPDDVRRLQGLMAEIGQLTHAGKPAQSQPRWYDARN